MPLPFLSLARQLFCLFFKHIFFFLFCYLLLHSLRIFLNYTKCLRFPLSGFSCGLSYLSLYMSSNFFATCFHSLSSSSHFSSTIPAFYLFPLAALPQLDFPRFVYFLLQSVALHLRVSAAARFLRRPHTTTLFAIFFTAEWIFAIRKSGFLSDSPFAFHSPSKCRLDRRFLPS